MVLAVLKTIDTSLCKNSVKTHGKLWNMASAGRVERAVEGERRGRSKKPSESTGPALQPLVWLLALECKDLYNTVCYFDFTDVMSKNYIQTSVIPSLFG